MVPDSSIVMPSTGNNSYFDNGATSHVTNDLSNLSIQHPYRGGVGVIVGSGNTLPIAHSGKGLLPTPHTSFSLSNILHVPLITHNLVSVYQFVKDNHCRITFDSNGFVVHDLLTNQVLHKGSCHQGLYPISPCTSQISHIALIGQSSNILLWHQRLGHPSLSLFDSLVNQFHLPVSKPLHFDCYSCNCAKSHKLVFLVSTSMTSAPFELLHMDVLGPAPIPSFSRMSILSARVG